MAIDIGSAAINRTGWGNIGGNTWIDYNNPANAAGTITQVQIFGYTTYHLVGCYVGIFYLSGDNYVCRSAVSLGTVTSGSTQTFSDLSLSVVDGDYIGLYASSGRIELTASGGGRYTAVGNKCSVGESIPVSSFTADSTISLFGSGVEGSSGFTFYGVACNKYCGVTATPFGM